MSDVYSMSVSHSHYNQMYALHRPQAAEALIQQKFPDELQVHLQHGDLPKQMYSLRKVVCKWFLTQTYHQLTISLLIFCRQKQEIWSIQIHCTGYTYETNKQNGKYWIKTKHYECWYLKQMTEALKMPTNTARREIANGFRWKSGHLLDFLKYHLRTCGMLNPLLEHVQKD